MSDQVIRTSIVGSYPKPRYVYDPRGDLLVDSASFYRLAQKIGQRRFGRRLDRAAAMALRDQRRAGLDFVTDGEERRDHYIWYVMRHLRGIDFQRLTRKPIRQEKLVRDVPTVVGELERTGPFLVEDFLFMKRHAGPKATAKMTLPGPITVADTVADEYYGSDMERLSRAYAAVIREEIRSLVEAGCTAIQIDDPVLLRYPREARDWGIEALESCFAGMEGRATWFVHVCRGYPDRTAEAQGTSYKAEQGNYGDILRLLASSKVDVISIEGAQGHLDLSVLPEAGDKTVMLGVLDVGSDDVEGVDSLIARGREALRYVPPERLILGPDCGMFQLSRRAARSKLINMVKAARALP